jgi:carboxyl-terminal processing protease
VPVNQKTAIKLTTARYFTPNGRSIQAEGIVPDIVLQNLTVAKGKQDGTTLKEAQLAHHLDNPNGDSDEPAADEPAKKKDEQPLAEKDYALNEALNLLKGLAILRAKEDT